MNCRRYNFCYVYIYVKINCFDVPQIILNAYLNIIYIKVKFALIFNINDEN